jgi:hypothetical protein
MREFVIKAPAGAYGAGGCRTRALAIIGELPSGARTRPWARGIRSPEEATWPIAKPVTTPVLHGDDDVAVLDRHLHGLSDERALHQDLARLDRDVERTRLNTVWITQ